MIKLNCYFHYNAKFYSQERFVEGRACSFDRFKTFSLLFLIKRLIPWFHKMGCESCSSNPLCITNGMNASAIRGFAFSPLFLISQ